MRSSYFWIFGLWILLTGVAYTADLGVGEPVKDQYVTAQLVAEKTAVAPGGSIYLALRLEHAEHWHTYWQNPGESGLPTELSWELPNGVTVTDIQWPTPEALEFFGLINYGFEDVALLLVELNLSEEFDAGEQIDLAARADWLMCADVCIPGGADLKLTLGVVPFEEPGETAFSGAISEAIKALPQTVSDLGVEVYREQGQFILDVLFPDGSDLAIPDQLYFFSQDEKVQPSGAQINERFEGGVRLIMQESEFLPEGDGFAGLLVATGESNFKPEVIWRALRVEADLSDVPPPVREGMSAAGPASSSPQRGMWAMIALGFVGGLILNLMPCVFPVLGLKIMGFVNQAGQDRRRIAIHGFVFTAGVLVSFWIMAGVLIALRGAGQELGWGFQLQSPEFVYLLAALLLAFGLNLSGVFEIGNSAVGVGQKLAAKKGYSGSFNSGILATVVATPCAAPFLAPALGAALAIPAMQSMVVFTAIGLGLSAPYLILSAFPKLVELLPRPGAWMETFKQFMAFLLYATVAYLVWVLVGQLDAQTQLVALFGLVVIGLSCWVYGRWAAFSKPKKARRVATAVTVVLLAVGLFMGLKQPSEDQAIVWEPWSEARVAQLVEEGRPIYVDFTARWCATCQYNKRVVFGSDRVLRYFQNNNVATLIADWTNRDPSITRALAEFDRTAIPFNLIYLPGRDQPIELPELLTPGIVLNAFEEGEVREADAS